MSGERERCLVKLKAAFDAGALDEDTYRAAVGALQPGPAEVAAVQGSGAAAQGSGVAAGAGGVAIAGDFRGSLYVGAPPVNRAEALAIYRRCLIAGARQLPLRGVDPRAADATSGRKQLDLDRVYVALDTKTRVEERRRRGPPQPRLPGLDTELLPALQAAVENRRLVLLGDPGSGKSTFVNHLGLCLALHGLEPGAGWQKRLGCWPGAEADLLPISVVLRDFARALPEKETKAEPRSLWRFITDRLKARNLGFAAKELAAALEEGRALVLFDGLDEIPVSGRRALVRDAVAAFVERYSAARMVVTCRTLSYEGRDSRLPGCPAFELAPFDEEKIDGFIEAWYAELERVGEVKADDSHLQARRLKEAVRRPDLWQLAPNPLLLTVMAVVHAHKGRLPDARALLYEEAVDILLCRWDEGKAALGDEAPPLRSLLLEAGRTEVDLKRVLGGLSFDAHGKGGAGRTDGLADIGELKLQKALAGLHPHNSRDWAAGVIDAMKIRAGLLLERAPEVYAFPHRTFQEYLAGAHLAAEPDFAKKGAALAAEGDIWRQVILLAVGRLVYLSGDTARPLAFVAELCPVVEVDGELAWRKAWLAGDVLLELGPNRARDTALGAELLDRVRHRLVRLLQAGAVQPKERSAAGDALGRLADPRPGVGVRTDGVPDIFWCDVPAGLFPMGNNKRDDPEAYGDEAPRHEHVIREPYRIAKYPITNVQFEAFIDDGGYTDRHRSCWTEAGWKWKAGQTGPEKYGGAFDLPNHPAVGVSWYAAAAFCRWLGKKLGQPVSLPSEPQWERVARHTDARRYPWGNEGVVAGRCNMGETGLGATSAVGIFPGGEAECGAADLAGNVFEWCSTKWVKTYRRRGYLEAQDDRLEGNARRVLRGGSFINGDPYVRCAYRSRYGPFVQYNRFGFRVVLSPFPLGSGDSEL